MAYPEKILADDEKVVEHLHPSWITLVPATLWFLVICAAAGAGIAFAPDHGTGRTVVLALIIGVGFLLLCWLTLALAPLSPSLVCIDEPDQGVHPRTLPKLAGLFEKLSQRTGLRCGVSRPRRAATNRTVPLLCHST